MKTLQLAPSSGVAGAERETYNLCRGLLGTGVEVVVVTSPGLRDEFARLRPTALYVMPGHVGRFLDRVRAYVRMVIFLRRVISVERPDVVHVQGSLARLLMLAGGRGVTTVETLHGVGLARGAAFQRVVSVASIALAALLFDEIISVSRPIHDGVPSYGAPSHYIPNSVDGEFFRFTPLDKKEKLVILVGRLIGVKNPGMLVDAVETIRTFVEQSGIKVKLIGDGPLRGQLERKIGAAGLNGSVSLEGSLGQDEVRDAMSKAFAYVSCSLSEGMSLALLEAMASGCVVVASDIPGNSAVVEHGRTGLLYPAGDPGRLGAMIQLAFRDAEASAGLARSARREFESRYDSGRAALAVARVYEAAIASRHSKGRGTRSDGPDGHLLAR